MARKSKKQSHDELLESTLERFDASWQYAEGSWHKRWERDWRLYNNQRHSQGYEGITDTFVPMAFSTIETMVAALGNGRPRFDYEPADPTQTSDTKPLNSLVDDYWESDRWDVKLTEAVRQMLTVGTAPLFMYWNNDRPCLTHFSIRDAIIDPSATDPENMGYAGRRYLSTVDALKDYKVVDVDVESKTYGELVDRYSNLDKLGDAWASKFKTPQEMDKAQKELFIGSTVPNAANKQVEVIEIWDNERVVTVVNRCLVIEDIENPYLVQSRLRGESEPKGLIPFVFLRNYTDVSLFYGKSEIEPIAPLQELLNDLTNQENDFIIKQLAPQRELDPVYADYIDLINNDPDTVYPFKPGSLQNVQSPVLPANSFNERMNIKNEIRETTAIDQVAKGAANVKDATATEVRAQLNQAGQRIEIKARMLENDAFFYMGKLLFRMIQLYVREPMAVKADGLEAKKQVEVDGVVLPKGTTVFDPSAYPGDWLPHVSLEVNVQNKKVETQRMAMAAYQVLIQDPTNNLAETKERLFPLMFPDLSAEDIEAITTPADDAGAPMGADPMSEAGMSPEAPMEAEVMPQEAYAA